MVQETIERQRMSENIHELVQQVIKQDARITTIENIVEKQTDILASIEKKFTRGSAIIGTLVFLMTPLGNTLWTEVLKLTA